MFNRERRDKKQEHKQTPEEKAARVKRIKKEDEQQTKDIDDIIEDILLGDF
jgi:hypothetical protein